MIRVGRESFEVEPLGPGNRCTPETVSAHMLYENSDPFLPHEPGACSMSPPPAMRPSTTGSPAIRGSFTCR